MNEEIEKIAKTEKIKHAQLSKAAWFFTGLCLVFMMLVVIWGPDDLPEFRQRALAVIAALLAGFAAFFILGDLKLSSQTLKTPVGDIKLQTGGGIGLFVLVLLWWLSPLSPVAQQSIITNNKIVQSKATVNGDGNAIITTAPVTINNNLGISKQDHEALAKKLGVTEMALANFLKIIEEKQVPLSDLDAQLRSIAEKYKALKQHAQQFKPSDPAVEKLVNQAKAHIENAEFKQAEELLKQAKQLDVDVARKNLAVAHARFRSAAESLALSAQSKLTRLAYQAASADYEEAIELARQAQAPEKIAELQVGLGTVYDSLAKYDKKIKVLESALVFYESSSAKPSQYQTQIVTIWNNLGSAWASKGDYDKAIGYYKKALKVDLAVHRDQHPNTARDWNNLGLAWQSKGDYDKAIGYYEKALDVYIKAFGEKHPLVATAWNNLGSAWESKGDYDKAIGYYEKALKVDLAVHGDKHPSTATDWNNLGSAWESKGHYDKAIGYYEKALQVRQSVFGDKHPDVAQSWNNLGSAWYAKGDYEKAQAYINKALKLRRLIFAPAHPDIVNSLWGLAVVLSQKGQSAQGIVHYQQALRMSKRVLGAKHATTRAIAAGLRQAQRQSDPALPDK